MRTVFKVMIAVETEREGSAVRALSKFSFDSGEPVTIVRPGRAVILLAVRTSATAV